MVLFGVDAAFSCTANPQQCGGTGGCGGATVSLAMQTMIASGAPQEFTYSYYYFFYFFFFGTEEATLGYASYFGANQTCQGGTQNAQPFAHVSGHVHLPRNEQQPVLQHLSAVGPLAGTVDASAWGSYETGVFSGCSVNATIDHGIQS